VPKYDVAVVGAGLGGLSVAALASLSKKKTIVLERGPSLSDALGVAEKSGFGFYAGPSLSYGFEPGGSLQEFTAHLGINQRTVVPSLCYQVALPDRRISVFSDHNETLEELKREFVGETSILEKFYRDLDGMRAQCAKNRLSAYFARHRPASTFFNTYGFSRELFAYFDVQSRVFFQKAAGDITLASLMTLCNNPPRRVQGGFRKIGDQMYSLLLQHGGEVRYDEVSPEYMVQDGLLRGLKTAKGDVIEAESIVLNMMPYSRREMLFVGLREQVVPVGMAHDVFLLTDYSSPEEIVTLSLNFNEEEAVSAPAGMRALCVSCQTPQDFIAGRQTLIEKLGKLMPFLHDYLVFTEEYTSKSGYAVIPCSLQMKIKPFRAKEGLSLLHRSSYKNVFVIHDHSEAPLQVISAVQLFAEKMN
jgi:glycine/D-amino acid oxidase-like deaminating enzyme